MLDALLAQQNTVSRLMGLNLEANLGLWPLVFQVTFLFKLEISMSTYTSILCFQNKRLPLKVVVQVLFSEQVKISNAMASNALKEAGDSQYQPMISNKKTLLYCL